MYEKTEIDSAMESFIAEAEKEYTPEPEIEALEATPVAETPDTAQENTAAPEVPNADPAERGFERIVARELDLREREAKFNSEKAEMEALRARLQELETRQLTPDILDKIRLSPREGLQNLGLDPDEVVRMALVEKLGDKANDPELKELMEKSRMRREFEALKAQMQQEQWNRAAAEYHAKVSADVNSYIRTNEGLSKHAPTVAGVAKTNPDAVFHEIMEEITRDARARAGREPNGDIIPFDEAAKRVEKRWSSMKALLGVQSTVQNPANASTPSPKTPVEATKVVNNPPSTIKPPEKPLAPWLQKKVDEEEAIKLAIAEWKRAETLK